MDFVPINLSDETIGRIADAVAARLRSDAPTDATHDRLYREPEVASLLNLALHTVRRLRQSGEIKASYPRRPVRYSLADIEAAKRVMQRSPSTN